MSNADVVAGQILERKAIGRLLAFQTARAAYRLTRTPWWKFGQQRRLRWTMACLTGTLEEIEAGEQCREPSQWLGGISAERLDRMMIEAAEAYDARKNEDDAS